MRTFAPLLPLTLLLACNSEQQIIAQGADVTLSDPPVYVDPVQEDRIVQVVVPEVDILFVVDNSSSMGNEQQQLQGNFPLFIDHFVTSGLDYHIGMVSTDMQRPDHSGLLREGMGVSIIDVDTELPREVFSAMTGSLGVHIGSVESGRAAAYSALELRQNEPRNFGFVREEADLHLIFVSDDEDQSGGNPVTKPEFINWALGLKEDPARVQMHGIVVPTGGCGSGTNTGASYIQYANATEGAIYSICEDDWGPALDALGVWTAGLKREFFLSRIPVTDPELLLEVRVRTTDFDTGEELTLTFEECLAGEEIDDPACDVVYTPGRNSITFLDYRPEPLAEILVSYPIAEAWSGGEIVETF